MLVILVTHVLKKGHKKTFQIGIIWLLVKFNVLHVLHVVQESQRQISTQWFDRHRRFNFFSLYSDKLLLGISFLYGFFILRIYWDFSSHQTGYNNIVPGLVNSFQEKNEYSSKSFKIISPTMFITFASLSTHKLYCANSMIPFFYFDMFVRTRVYKTLRQAKVNEADNVLLFAVAYHNVLRLKISVNEVLTVHPFDSINHLNTYHQHSFQREAFFTVLEQLHQVWSHYAHDQAKILTNHPTPVKLRETN